VPGATGAAGVSAEIKNGIQKLSETEFKVDRGVVDKILENQAELMRQARIVPEQENGKVVGIRLFGVRPDTLLGTLGMENGDRLEKINGFDMTSPESALEAYARLRTADKLTVSINRRGQAMNVDYNIK
jgi:general secretion pathway protein C